MASIPSFEIMKPPSLRFAVAGRSCGLFGFLRSLQHTDPAYVVASVIAASMMLRLVFACSTGLVVDEAYMVAISRNVRLGYFDHPPISWWLCWASTHILGTDAAFAARLPFVTLFSLSTWLMYRLTSVLFGREAGVWAAVAMNLSPVIGVTSASWVLPDGPLIAFLLGFLLTLTRAMTAPDGRSSRWWLVAGMCAGLALMSKYTAIFVLSGTILAVLTHPVHRKWLARPGPWFAVSVAGVVFLPAIVWNAHHDWCSFWFQAGRASGWKFHPLAPLVVFGGEALFFLPWIWGALVVSLVLALHRGRQHWPSWLLFCAGTPAILFFGVVGLWSRNHVLFHWADCGYLCAFPLAGSLIASRHNLFGLSNGKMAMASAALILICTAGAVTEQRWNWVETVAPGMAPMGRRGYDNADWVPLVPELRERGWLRPNAPAFAVVRWHYAGKLDYALKGAAPVICLGDDPREYGILHPPSAYNRHNLLLLAPGMSRYEVEALVGKDFLRIEVLPALSLLVGDGVRLPLNVYYGVGFHAPQA